MCNFGGNVFAIGGLSLGGQILVEMLSQDADICEKTIIESALVKPMRATNCMISPMIKMSYGFIKKDWFAKLQFAQLRIKPDLFQDYYIDTCKITRSNMISFLKCNSSYKMKDTLKNTTTKAIIAVGGREQKIMKESADILHEIIPQSEMILFPDFYHGELSLPIACVNLVLLPVTTAFAEDGLYLGCGVNQMKNKYLAVCIPAFFFALQHSYIPVLWDGKYMIYRFLSFLPLTISLCLLYRRKRNPLPIMVGHAVIDLATAAQILATSAVPGLYEQMLNM